MDNKLPDEILHHIMEYATNETLISCTLVNRNWYQLAAHNSLWKDQHRFKNTYGNKKTNYANYRKFVSETKKQTFEYCRRNDQLIQSEENNQKLIKIGLAILAVFCPPLAGIITKIKVEDDEDMTSAITSLACVVLVFIGTFCLWIPGVIIAWLYILTFPLK